MLTAIQSNRSAACTGFKSDYCSPRLATSKLQGRCNEHTPNNQTTNNAFTYQHANICMCMLHRACEYTHIHRACIRIHVCTCLRKHTSLCISSVQVCIIVDFSLHVLLSVRSYLSTHACIRKTAKVVVLYMQIHN